MNEFVDRFAEPGIWALAGWSLRWAVPIVAMAAFLAVRPPRRAATRHLMGVVVLWTGLILPIVPRWGPGLWHPAPDPAPGSEAPAPPPAVDPKTGPVAMPGPIPTAGRPPSPAPAPAVEAPASLPIGPPAPAQEPPGARRLVVLGLWAAYLAGVASFLVRLAIGRRLVDRLRGTAGPVGAESGRQFELCAAEVAPRRRVALARHAAIAAPAAIGGRPPMVLVPADWDDRPSSVRRACLLHELAHLARYDDRSKIGLELLRAAFFFHPMVLWLLARLERERELLCDEAAVARGVDPRDYARMLLDFARRPGGLLIPGVPQSLPFFGRETVKPRIEHLLEVDMERWISPLPARRAFAIGGVVMGLALGLGGARVVAVAVANADARPGPTSSEPIGPRIPAAGPIVGAPPQKVDAIEEVKAVARAGASLRINGKVVDAETGKPIPNYVVQDGRPDPKDPGRIAWGWSEGRIESANPDGVLRETLGEKGSWKRVLAAGYLPQPITEKPHDGEGGQVEVTVRLRRGRQIAGRVLDPAGKPVAGASVFLVGGRASPNITGGIAVRPFVGGEDRTVTRATTDAEGRFTLTGAGAEATTVAVSSSTLDLHVAPAPPEGKELEIILPASGKLVLRYDIDGAEPEATVFLQLLRQGPGGWDAVQYLREPTVANKGRVVLDNLRPGTYDLSRYRKNLRVGDAGISPFLDRQNVVVEAGKSAEVAFVRESGTPVEGEVIGLKELKVPGAFLLVNLGDEARDGRPDRFAEKHVEALTCDEAGRFRTPRLLPGTYTVVAEAYIPETPEQKRRTGWRVADHRAFAVVTVPKDGPAPRVRIVMPRPKDEAKKAVEGQVKVDDRPASGSPARLAGASPRRAPQTSARPTLAVGGRVIDASSGRPIDRFRVVPGALGSVGVTWQPHLITDHEGGRFDLPANPRAWDETQFRVEAEGYRPGVSRVVKKSEGKAAIDFPLQPDPGISAVVRTPGGAPAAGAQAAWATQSREATLRGSSVRLSGHAERLGARVVSADASGRIHLPPEVDPGVIVVGHESGQAAVRPADLVSSGVVSLRPWGRVEGRILAGPRPVSGQTVWIYAGGGEGVGSPTPPWHAEAITDADGRFSCDRVVPGRAIVDRAFSMGEVRASVSGLATPIEVREGQTARVTLGGPGRAVVGRIEAPEGFRPAIDWSQVRVGLSLKAPHFGFPGDEPVLLAYQAFLATDEGRAYSRNGLPAGRDGSIRIEGVPPGEYLLSVRVAGPAVGKPTEAETTYAMGNAEVQVSPMDDGLGHPAQPIGTIRLRAVAPES